MLEMLLIGLFAAWMFYILICWIWPDERTVTTYWCDSSAFLDMLLAAELIELIEEE